MESRVRLGLSLLPLLAVLVVSGCKTADKQEDEIAIDAGMPPVASVATAEPVPADPAAVPTVIAPTPNPSPTGATPKPDAGVIVDAGVKADAGTVVADAGTATNAKLQACAARCQAVLVGCAIPQASPDGGLPQIKDPVACQAAATACFSACTP